MARWFSDLITIEWHYQSLIKMTLEAVIVMVRNMIYFKMETKHVRHVDSDPRP